MAQYTIVTVSRLAPARQRVGSVIVPTDRDAQDAFRATWTGSPDLTRAALRRPDGVMIAGAYRNEEQ